MRELEGKVAVITGGASGIGEASARLFVAEGAKVVIADMQRARGEALARELGEAAKFVPCEVRQEEQVKATVDTAVDAWGRLDCMFNNAGFGDVGPVETMDLDRARAMFEVNVFGLVGLTQLVLPPMRERRRGRIVNLSSIAGRFVTPGAGWYGASKHALEGISDALRLELHQFGVQVVLVEPGLIRTGFEAASADAMAAEGRDAVWGPMMRQVAAGWAEGFRKGSEPEVVVRTIVTALEASDPQPRYRCGRESEAVLVQRLMPTRFWDALVRQRMIGR